MCVWLNDNDMDWFKHYNSIMAQKLITWQQIKASKKVWKMIDVVYK